MNEPTKEELERFWLWCGLTSTKSLNGNVDVWHTPDGRLFSKKAVSLTLDNIFRYAVPKLDDLFLDGNSKKGFTAKVRKGDVFVADSWHLAQDAKLELALFHAIMQVIE